MGGGKSSKGADGAAIIIVIILVVLYIVIEILKFIFNLIYLFLSFIWSVLLIKNIWLNFIILWGVSAFIILRITILHPDVEIPEISKRRWGTESGIFSGFSIALGIMLLDSAFKLSIPLLAVLTISLISFFVSSPFIFRADEKAKKYLEYLQTFPGLFETSNSLSIQAYNLFKQKKYDEALQTYEKAKNQFISAGEGAKAINDIEKTNTISNNISVAEKNIILCNNLIGAEMASKAISKVEKRDYNGAIEIYNESLNYFQDPESISKVKSNIEKCYIEIDSNKVTELYNKVTSLLKEKTKLNDTLKVRDILKQADNTIDEAVTLAKKRNFTDALSKLNAISKNTLIQRSNINEKITCGVDVVDSGTDGIETDESGNGSQIKEESETIGDFGFGKHIIIQRGYELLPRNNMRFGIRVENKSSFYVMDVQIILDYPKTLIVVLNDDAHSIGNIIQNGKRTAEFILRPLGCIHNEQINALITFKDHTGKNQTLHMRPKEVHCVCPFLKEKRISEDEYKRLVENSEFLHDGISFKGISTVDLSKFMGETCRHILHKVGEYDNEGKKMIYLSGESVGEKAYYLLTAVIQENNGLTQVALRAYSDKKYGLNGFMKEIADSLRVLVGSVQNAKEIGIIENTQVINIINSVVEGTSFNTSDSEKMHVDIKHSLVQRSNIQSKKLKY